MNPKHNNSETFNPLFVFLFINPQKPCGKNLLGIKRVRHFVLVTSVNLQADVTTLLARTHTSTPLPQIAHNWCPILAQFGRSINFTEILKYQASWECVQLFPNCVTRFGRHEEIYGENNTCFFHNNSSLKHQKLNFIYISRSHWY